MCLVPLLFAYVKATQTVSICASTTSAGWSRTLTSVAIVPSGTLRITNLHVDSEFVIVAEVNDVVAAVAGASGTTQALSMDRKQKRRPANQHVRIINRGFDGIHRES